MTPESKRVYLQFLAVFVSALVLMVGVNLALVGERQRSTSYEASEGYRVIQRYGCLSCHKLAGKGSSVGPALDGVGSRRDRRWLEAWIRSPWSVKPGSRMPTLHLPPKDLRAVVNFLSALKEASADSVASGKVESQP